MDGNLNNLLKKVINVIKNCEKTSNIDQYDGPNHIQKILNDCENTNVDNKNNIELKINKKYLYEHKKILGSNYDIEKFYAIKLNHVGKFKPNNTIQSGFMWLNTENNTINIYYDNKFYEFPIFYKSIIRQYIKRPIKRIDC